MQTYTHSSKIDLNRRNFVLENSNKWKQERTLFWMALETCVWFTQAGCVRFRSYIVTWTEIRWIAGQS
jgi:hypothetical protein